MSYRLRLHPHQVSASTTTRDRALYHDYFRAIPFQRLAYLLEQHRIEVGSRRWLVAGCGKGTDLRYLTERIAADWTAIDISPSAIRAAADSYPNVKLLEADLEGLPFDDGSFDVCFTAATLHHLRRPMLGLYELLRVSRETTIVIEPNDSWLTRLATRIGAAHEYEDAGNYVYRLGAGDACRLGKAAFLTVHVDRFFATHRIAHSSLEFGVLRALNAAANTVAPRLGNYIVLVIQKPSPLRPPA